MNNNSTHRPRSAASERQEAKLLSHETATLRRAFCLERIASELREHGDSLRCPGGVQNEPMTVNRQEGYVLLFLPVKGERKRVRMDLSGASETVLQVYEAIHAELMVRQDTSSTEDATASGEKEMKSDVADRPGRRRRSFFSALHYAPPSEPLRAGSSSLASSHTNCNKEDVATAPPSARMREVEVVEIVDSLAPTKHCRASTSLSQESIKDTESAGTVSEAGSAVSTLRKKSETTLDDGSQPLQDLTPPPRVPSTSPRDDVVHNVPVSGRSRRRQHSQDSAADARQETPSQVRRELEEFFPPPARRRTERSDDMTVAAQGGSSGRSCAKRNRNDGALRAPATMKTRKRGRAQQGPQTPPALAPSNLVTKLEGGSAPVPVPPAASDPGRDLLRVLYELPDVNPATAGIAQLQPVEGVQPLLGGVSRDRSVRAPRPSTPRLNEGPSTGEEELPVSHLRTLRRRERTYSRFAEDEAYAARTYGVGESDAMEDSAKGETATPAARLQRNTENENTPREFWDITFSSHST